MRTVTNWWVCVRNHRDVKEHRKLPPNQRSRIVGMNHSKTTNDYYWQLQIPQRHSLYLLTKLDAVVQRNFQIKKGLSFYQSNVSLFWYFSFILFFSNIVLIANNWNRWLLSEIRAEGPVRTLYLHETVNPAEVQTLLKKMTQKTSKKTKEKKKKEVKEKVDAKSQVTSSIDSVFNENESEGASDDDDIDDREFVALERKVHPPFKCFLWILLLDCFDCKKFISTPYYFLSDSF